MAEQLFQIGVKALIRNASQHILLEGKYRSGGDVTYDFPGGRVDEGESFEEALRRELKEEIGLPDINGMAHIATTLTKLHPQSDNRTV